MTFMQHQGQAQLSPSVGCVKLVCSICSACVSMQDMLLIRFMLLLAKGFGVFQIIIGFSASARVLVIKYVMSYDITVL